MMKRFADVTMACAVAALIVIIVFQLTRKPEPVPAPAPPPPGSCADEIKRCEEHGGFADVDLSYPRRFRCVKQVEVPH